MEGEEARSSSGGWADRFRLGILNREEIHILEGYEFLGKEGRGLPKKGRGGLLYSGIA